MFAGEHVEKSETDETGGMLEDMSEKVVGNVFEKGRPVST